MSQQTHSCSRVNGYMSLTAYAPPQASNDGVLVGLGLAVKDLFDVAGMPTSAGNPRWLETHPIPKVTHEVVTKLLNQGAHFTGKTITDELAYSLNGQNIHYGTPINPLTPSRLPGGSSSGSAVAVADGTADIGLGTDTGGSIRVPASYNGLYGLRPTHGRLSTANMVALAPSFDTVGWVTRSIDDMQKVANCLFAPVTKHTDTIRIMGLVDLIDMADHQHNIRNWCNNNQASYAELGTTLIAELSEAFRVLQGQEIWQQHGEWIETCQPDFAADIQLRFDSCKAITEDQINKARTIRGALNDQLNTLFCDADVLVLPTTPGIAPLLTASSDELFEYRKRLLTMTAVAGLAGLPQLHLPLFSYDNAPCGLSLIGAKNTDMLLLELAQSLRNE